MREILFRGTKFINGEWVEGLLVKDKAFYGKPENHAYIVNHECPSGCFGRDIYFEVDPATVGQYTGLTDKNGKKIFEGDVVKHFNDNSNPENFDTGVILWNQYACQWERTSFGHTDHYKIAPCCQYEVIDNIHDNPEFLYGGATKYGNKADPVQHRNGAGHSSRPQDADAEDHQAAAGNIARAPS